MSESSGVKKNIAELIGTFVLVFIGCGSAVFSNLLGIPLTYALVGIAFAFELAVLVMVYAIRVISGCHINPAVSISMLASSKLSVKDAIVYIAAQCVGAIIGTAVLYWIAAGNPQYSLALGLGQNGYDLAPPSGFSMASAFVAEVILTFIFLLVIHGSTSEKALKGFAEISIGLSLVLVHVVGNTSNRHLSKPSQKFRPSNHRRRHCP
jgi:aquaporin Z